MMNKKETVRFMDVSNARYAIADAWAMKRRDMDNCARKWGEKDITTKIARREWNDLKGALETLDKVHEIFTREHRYHYDQS